MRLLDRNDTVLGTVFTVERVADRIGVSVERGTVRVDWGVGTRLLRVGDSGWFPPLLVGKSAAPRPAAPPPAPELAADGARAADRRSEPRPAATEMARARAETARELLAAADAARLRGQADDGAALLRRLLRERRGDPRAPLAEFTLGRLLLIELDRPRDAAAAFADVRTLAPGGPFAEDALAREVEAWAKAKETGKARVRAEEYLRTYPGGRRTQAVRTLGGIP